MPTTAAVDNRQADEVLAAEMTSTCVVLAAQAPLLVRRGRHQQQQQQRRRHPMPKSLQFVFVVLRAGRRRMLQAAPHSFCPAASALLAPMQELQAAGCS